MMFSRKVYWGLEMESSVGKERALLCKCENPTPIPRIHVKKLGVVAHTYNPSAREETGEPLGLTD